MNLQFSDDFLISVSAFDMPSIFAWRPSKLHVRLKKLSHQLGNASGTAANAAFQSSDDEDEFDDATLSTASQRHMLDGDDEVKRLIVRRPAGSSNSMDGVATPTVAAVRQSQKNTSNSVAENVSTIPVRMSEASVSDDEYFCAKSIPKVSKAAKAATFQSSTGPIVRQRAVRFSEEISTSTSRSHQPPVCNVAPTNFATRGSGNDSLQIRALTSPAPDAAALPPRYSPSPALKTTGTPAIRSTGLQSRAVGASSGDESSRGYFSRGVSSIAAFDSTSENETGGEYEEQENRRPPRPARSASAQSSTRNRANIILQHLRADSDLSANSSPITVPSTAQRSSYGNTPPAAKFLLSAPSESSQACFVFLEFNDEVKRSAFPTNIHSLDQIKSLFLRTFPNLSLDYLNQPYVKIYIQESSKGHLFYELDDIKEVKEHSLLKIREQQSHPQHHAHHRNFQSPQPVLRYLDAGGSNNNSSSNKPLGVVDYVSEPELEYGVDRARYRHYDSGASGLCRYGDTNYSAADQSQQRPASVLPRMEDAYRQYYSTRSPLQFQSDPRHGCSPITSSTHSLPLPRVSTSYTGGVGVSSSSATSLSSSSSGGVAENGGYAPLYGVGSAYYDPYYSSGSESSRASRSGSSTPIMMLSSQAGSVNPTDNESTRQRVDSMERQLAGLSTLVHSALITREMNPVIRQEMMQLQRQILELQTPCTVEKEEPAVSALRWSDKRANSTLAASDRRVAILHRLQRQIKETRDELQQLRRTTQVSAHSYRELLSDAAERIRSELYSIGASSNSMSSSLVLKSAEEQQQNRLDGLRRAHLDKLAALQNALRKFEGNVEEIRNSVLNSNRKLRIAEVEQLTNTLTQIGKDSAIMKTRFPELQTELEKEIRRNMENIVREEKFIKEERDQVDECLRRCRNLANMMVTMKKLAMVQDPSLKSLKTANGSLKVKSAMRGVKSNGVTPSSTTATTKLTGVATTIHSNNSAAKPAEHAAVNVEDDASKAHVLDNILDELNYLPAVAKKALSTLSPPKSPPKPPERKRYHTTEIRLQYERENGVGLIKTASVLPNQAT